MFIDLSEITQRFEVQPDYIALGPSVLQAVATGELELQQGVRFAVPDILFSLLMRIQDGDPKAANVLSSVFQYFAARNARLRESNVRQIRLMAARLIDILESLRKSGTLEPISFEVVDPQFRSELSRLYEQPRFQIELSPKSSFLKEYVSRVYSWAKEKGHVVLERGRRIFHDLRTHVHLLEILDKADSLVRWKAEFFERRIRFRGYRATKLFLGISLSVVGAAYSEFGTASILIAFVDP